MSTFAERWLCAPPHEIFQSRGDIAVSHSSALIYGGDEERSQLSATWLSHFQPDDIYRINEHDEIGQISIDGLGDRVFSFRQSGPLREWVKSLIHGDVFLDITGLDHYTWMPLVRMMLEESINVRCVYNEPGRYTPSNNPRPGEFYDLSEKLLGFRPIPSLAKLPSRSRSGSLLIPLLGFEGVRFKHLVEMIEPNERDIFPIIGVPGFEIDYPFHTYEGNADGLKSTRAWQRVDYADASCPFSLFNRIAGVRRSMPDKFLQIATIGTKPHALGALLFSLKDVATEILYDHPVKKKGRTQGTGKCHLYDVAKFWRIGH